MSRTATQIETPPTGEGTTKLAVAAGAFGAIAASSCCILPLLLFGIGVSGAWIGNLTSLAPYQPYFIAFALANMAYGGWRVYRFRQVACEPGSACAKPINNTIVVSGLVVAALLVAAALSFNFVAPFFLGT